MTPGEFGEMRLKFFFMKVQEYFKSREEDYRFYGEIMRLQTAKLMNNNRSLSKQVKPEKLWTFSWEEDEQTDRDQLLTEMHRDEFEASYRAFLGLS